MRSEPTLLDELRPVIESILASADDDATETRMDADRRAALTIAQGLDRARRTLEEAKAVGARAAETASRNRQAEVRRECHERVLRARRKAFEDLRAEAIRLVDLRLRSPSGSAARHAAASLVDTAVGVTAAQEAVTTEGWTVTARSDDCFASIGAAWLVDQAIWSMPREIEALWG